MATLDRLFVARHDCYALQQPGSEYYCIEAPVTLELLERHLRGELTPGVYPLSKFNLVKWICLDIDPEKLEDPLATANKIVKVCLEEDEEGHPRIWPKSILLEASRYGDPSYHVWIFFSPPFPAKAARWLGLRVLELASLNPKQIEVFPKQCELTEDRPYGNCVKLVLGKHRVAGKWSKFLDLETFKPLPNGVVHQVEGISFSEADVERIMS